MRLIQLNIEGDAHIEKVQSFLASEHADVLCVQEVFKSDIAALSSLPHVAFMPMMLKAKQDGSIDELGVAICSEQAPLRTDVHYYFSPHDELRMHDSTSIEAHRASIRYGIIMAEILPGIRIATTHHTWTPHGNTPNEYQKHDTNELVAFLKTQPPMILCGDFNTPRGYNECYDLLTTYLEDCVPAAYTSSMHMPLHRLRSDPIASKEIAQYMVDYIFRTPGAPEVRDVSMKCGMSDHCALLAHIG